MVDYNILFLISNYSSVLKKNEFGGKVLTSSEINHDQSIFAKELRDISHEIFYDYAFSLRYIALSILGTLSLHCRDISLRQYFVDASGINQFMFVNGRQ